MSAPRLILSACGTSLLSNSIEGGMRGRLFAFANAAGKDNLAPEQNQLMEAALENAHAVLSSDDASAICKASAELNALFAWHGDNDGPQAGDHHILLATDTYQGRAAAAALESWMLRKGWSVEILVASGLRTDNHESFQTALADLAKALSDRFSGADSYKEKNWRVVFNLTGGFKGVSAFLQTAALLWADESFYMFDDKARSLLVIPRLPLTLSHDWFALHPDLARRLGQGDAPHEETQRANAPSSLILAASGAATFSAYGQLLWGEAKKKIYEAALIPPLDGLMSFTEKARKEAEALPHRYIAHVNEAIGALHLWLKTGREPVKSNTIKQLQKKRASGATHEIYVSSDPGAKRMFFAKTGQNAQILEIANHD